MGLKSHIEWTESTWNPVTGCTKISPGCKHCYAERMASRLQAMGQRNYANGFALTIQEHALDLPLRWKKPQRIFVNSMSDLFHNDVPLEYIQRVFKVMRQAHWHQFQVLTKRAERLSEIADELDWPENVWMGVSIDPTSTPTAPITCGRRKRLCAFSRLNPCLDHCQALILFESTGSLWAASPGRKRAECRKAGSVTSSAYAPIPTYLFSSNRRARCSRKRWACAEKDTTWRIWRPISS
jgi:Protein of unknown function (DUF5131)